MSTPIPAGMGPGPVGAGAGGVGDSILSAGTLTLAIGLPIVAAAVLFFFLVVIWKRLDWRFWRQGHPVVDAMPAKAAVVVAVPRAVKIPVVIMQPDRSYEVAFPYAARHHARTASGSSPCGCHHDDFRLLTVMDAAQGGPLWSAAGVTRSEAGGTPCGSPTSAALCRASGAFGTAADLAQGHAASQQQSPVGGDVMPLPGEAPAAETAPQPGSPGLAAFKHRRRRSFDVSWLGRRLEKEAQLAPLEKELEACSPAAAAAAAAAAEAASCVELGVACSPQGSPVSVLPSLPRVPRHFRSRSASVASQVFGAGRAEEMV